MIFLVLFFVASGHAPNGAGAGPFNTMEECAQAAKKMDGEIRRQSTPVDYSLVCVRLKSSQAANT